MQRLEELFAEVAGARPDQVAIRDRAVSVSYGDLLAEAGQVARQLRAAGVRPGGLVGLRVERTWWLVPAILGIWQAGCGYVPIDPDHPADRQRFIIDDSRVALVLEGRDRRSAVDPPGTGAPAGWQVPPDAAYLIYTSGSTGTPKGVLVRHAHVVALLRACWQVFDFAAADVWSQFHSHNFDFSVWELWGSLLTGARCVIVPPATARDPEAFAALLEAEQVSVLSQVPSVFRQLVRALEDQPRDLSRLRHVIFGGEALDVSAVRRWHATGAAPGAALTNMYGITETTVHVTWHRLTAGDLALRAPGTPIGRPLPHLRVALLAAGKPVPDGTPGEIHVAGAGVTGGYLGRPDLTADRFPTIDLGNGPEMWYASGDYAVRRNGELYFLGRRDDQVQQRGHRIELGEVEEALRAADGVREGAVVQLPSSSGEAQLVGCYVPGRDRQASPTGIREQLRSRLPSYMVPARLAPVPAIPVTPQGKLDRSRLVAMLRGQPGERPERTEG